MARPILEIIAEMQTSAGQPATNLPLSEVKRWADELAEWVTELKSAPVEPLPTDDAPVPGVADPDEEQQVATAAMEAAGDEFASDPKPDPDDPTANSE
jgi:hypothetical protein